MADNSLQTGSDTIATDDLTTLNGGVVSGVKAQRVKVTYGDDGTARDVSTSFPLPAVTPSSYTTGTITAANANITTGTATANSTVQVTVPDQHSSWTIQVGGTFSSGTVLYTQGSLDGTTWFSVNGRRNTDAATNDTTNFVASDFTGGAAPSGSNPSMWRGVCGGVRFFRVTAFSYTAADSISVQISTSAGVGATFLNNIPNVQLSDGTSATLKAKVDASGNLGVLLGGSSGLTQTSGSISAAVGNTPGTGVTASTTAQIVAGVATAGNATFHVVAAAFVGTLTFEASLDAGLNYAPIMAIREDGTGSESSIAINTASTYIRQWTVAIPGLTYFRVRCSAFTSGTAAVVIAPGPFLIEPNPSLAAGSNNVGAVQLSDATTLTQKAAVNASGAVSAGLQALRLTGSSTTYSTSMAVSLGSLAAAGLNLPDLASVEIYVINNTNQATGNNPQLRFTDDAVGAVTPTVQPAVYAPFMNAAAVNGSGYQAFPLTSGYLRNVTVTVGFPTAPTSGTLTVVAFFHGAAHAASYIGDPTNTNALRVYAEGAASADIATSIVVMGRTPGSGTAAIVHGIQTDPSGALARFPGGAFTTGTASMNIGSVRTTTTATVANTTQLVAAPAAGLSLYITDINVSNSGATGTLVQLSAASAGTPFIDIWVPPTSSQTRTLNVPIKLAAATGLFWANSAATTTLYLTVAYYYAP